MKRLFLSASLILFFIVKGSGQELKPMMMKPKKPIICYANSENQHTLVPAPEAFLRAKTSGARTKTATINVTYNGFTAQAQSAFQYAVEIWESILVSDVPINIVAQWQSLGDDVLGSAIWGTVHANFPNAQKLNTWYPAALAEKMAGRELNDPETPDIYANFSSDANWYYSTSGTPSAGQYDLVTVVLHEIGHGLGFVDSYTVSGENGVVGISDTEIPINFDLQIENSGGSNLFQTYASPSPELKTQLTSNSVYYSSQLVKAANAGERARLYAPSTFDNGSSIAHLNESTYLPGNANSLMTPQIGAAEKIHDPGPITKALFSDLGWRFTRIDHEPLKDTENEDGPYTVTVFVESDEGPATDITLFYSNGGGLVELTMTATSSPNEYVATIPGTGVPTTYAYYISATDNLSRVYTNPGKIVSRTGEEQSFFSFSSGPDTESPEIAHAPKTFIQDGEASLPIEANVTDNLGIDQVTLDYNINGVAQSPIIMTAPAGSSTYSASIDVSALTVGDVIEYKITATDIAVAQNVTTAPETGFYTVNVVGLGETLEAYSNNFNEPSDDFFGDGFSITTPEGFNDPAIHTSHPYPEGNSFPNQAVNFLYQLKNPIRVAERDALIKFDEIALIEPGDDGSQFGDEGFYDFVVVEGSLDGGITWTAIEDGYDARAHSIWLNKYLSSINGNNSTAVADPSLFKPRVIDLLNAFSPGDEVAIRFRLFSDPYAVGWGWSVDNLKIQIDDVPPTIRHDHRDYTLPEETELAIRVQAEDANGIKALDVEYSVNGGNVEVYSFPVVGEVFQYDLTLDISSLNVGDYLEYRIIATDSSNNIGTLPAEGSIKVIVFSPEAAVESYIHNFDEPSNDFIGNFFSQSTPTGFSNVAIHSVHPYPLGFGLNDTTNIQYMLTHPLVIEANNPYIQFKEVVLVEGHPTSGVFGTPGFTDYVIAEGSSDNGATWERFEDGYDLTGVAIWANAFGNLNGGNSSLFRLRTISMLGNGNFSAGEEVLVRFRLFSNATIRGWGWAIDNLSIQGPVTSIEQMADNILEVYPNPVEDELTITFESLGDQPVMLSLINIQGKTVFREFVMPVNGRIEKKIQLGDRPSGLYILKASAGEKTITRKIVKK